MPAEKKLWGGRFEAATDAEVEGFTESISYDRRLFRYDIAGSIAHCRMLASTGILRQAEAEQIEVGLRDIEREIEQDSFPFATALEDIHMNIEARLREKIGPLAGKLHTARSRNDQVALDLRLYTRSAVQETCAGLLQLQQALVTVAERESETVVPGYTHTQRAQPVLLAHHLLAYVEMFGRDFCRLRESLARVNISPLGSGALAGVAYPVDRQQVARELGMAGVTANSMDAVSDRDFVLEYLFAASLIMTHLSRLAEELVLWSTAEFGLLEMDDAFATGSSIMPQKKNADVAELCRGKSGRVYGHLLGLLTTLKGLPLTYNRDLQEDKEGLFDAVDTVLACLRVTTPMLLSLKVNRKRGRELADGSFALATDLADYLVGKGMPFREAHAVVGKLVGELSRSGLSFADVTLPEYQQVSPLFGEDVLEINIDSSLAARDVEGGTAPRRVAEALQAAQQRLRAERAWLESDVSP